MNAATEHERFAEDVGAYMLGALDPGEERSFVHHLETCHLCQEEVNGLSVAVDALPASVDPLVPPASLKAALMETVRAEAADHASAGAPAARRPGRLGRLLLARPAFAAAAACALLLVGVAAGALLGAFGSGGSSAPREISAKVDTTRLANTATARLVVPSGAKSHGGAVLRVSGMPQPLRGDVYEVWVTRGGQVAPVSLFDVNSQGDGAAAIPDKLAGVDAVLVTREHRGGAAVPSERPVVSVDLE
jgi:anti-sigma-K factor RskA